MSLVDAAEKEASEVLHSLLSVERIEKPDQVIVVVAGEHPSLALDHSYHNANNTEIADGDPQIQWNSPVSIATQSLFTAINEANNHFPQTLDDQQVIWEGHTINVTEDASNTNHLYPDNTQSNIAPVKKSLKPNNKLKTKKANLVKKKRKITKSIENTNVLTKIEDSAVQVKERFRRGCECQDETCFRGLNSESVFKHRLNIEELTKGEHDMYLMGVTMACLANPETTVRHKERRRLRAQYVYQGRRVCLDAFLYLENCTHYQLKRIRKHVMTHGVAPRVHGNHGKKPHNTFSLHIYKHATEFLKQYLETHTGETGITNTKQVIQLPWDVSRKNLHDAYKEYGQILEPGIKLMGYSTFRHFMKKQFPNVKFCKVEPKTAAQHKQEMQQGNQQQPLQQQQQQQQQNVQHITEKNQAQMIETRVIQKSEIAEEVQQVIPLVVAEGNENGTVHQQQTAFLVTSMPQLLPNSNLVSAQHSGNHVTSNAAFSYQLTNAGYVINEHGNLVTMSNPHHPPYTFNRM